MQAGNYAWGRHLKRSAAARAEDEDEEGSILASPTSASADTPSRQTPDSVSETGKGKRRHTLTQKALELEQVKKRRHTGTPHTKGASRNDEDSTTPSQTQPRRLSASKVNEGGSSAPNINSRFKQSHPLAVQATFSDEMDVDSKEELVDRSNSPDNNSSFSTPIYPFGQPTATVCPIYLEI